MGTGRAAGDSEVTVEIPFSGHQFGVWAALVSALHAAGADLTARIAGRNTLTGRATHLEGRVVLESGVGPEEWLVVAGPKRRPSVGGAHAVDEDVAADALTLSFEETACETPRLGGSPLPALLRMGLEPSRRLEFLALVRAGAGGQDAAPYLLAARALAPPRIVCEIASARYATSDLAASSPATERILHANLFWELDQVAVPLRAPLLEAIEDAFLAGRNSAEVLPDVCELLAWASAGRPSKRLVLRFVSLLSHPSGRVRGAAAATLSVWMRGKVVGLARHGSTRLCWCGAAVDAVVGDGVFPGRLARVSY